jgi:uncharacterized membrane protein YphA (DoxX/SURF4 family)
MNINLTMKKFAPTVLRLGLVMVFIWFGTNQLLSQAMWVGLIPKSVVSMSGLSAVTIVIINGVFELCMATLLAFGIKIRIVATLLAIHLLTIIGDLGLTAVAVRDIGLFFAMISVVLQGADEYSYDAVVAIKPQ